MRLDPPVGYPLETARLRLRPFRETDRADHDAYESREDVTRYLPYAARDPQECAAALARKTAWTSLASDGARLVLAVEERATGRVVGELHLSLPDPAVDTGEIGFVLHPDRHGQGLAREAVERLLQLAVEELGLTRLVGVCEVANTASAGLMRRLGMRRVQERADGDRRLEVWATTAQELRARTPGLARPARGRLTLRR